VASSSSKLTASLTEKSLNDAVLRVAPVEVDVAIVYEPNESTALPDQQRHDPAG